MTRYRLSPEDQVTLEKFLSAISGMSVYKAAELTGLSTSTIDRYRHRQFKAIYPETMRRIRDFLSRSSGVSTGPDEAAEVRLAAGFSASADSALVVKAAREYGVSELHGLIDGFDLETDPLRRASRFLSRALQLGNLSKDGSEENLAILWRELVTMDGFEEINPAAVLLGLVSERIGRLSGDLADCAAALRSRATRGGEEC